MDVFNLKVKKEGSLFIDMVKGDIGTLIDVKENYNGRVDLWFRPIGWTLRKIPRFNVPRNGLIFIPSARLQTKYDWVILIDDGTSSEAVVLEELKVSITDLAKKLEDVKKMSKIKETALKLREIEMERKIEDKVRKELEKLKMLKSKKRPGRIIEDIDEF